MQLLRLEKRHVPPIGEATFRRNALSFDRCFGPDTRSMRTALLLLVAVLISCNATALTPEGRIGIIHDLKQGRADDAFQLLQPVTAAGNQDAEAEQLLCRLALQLERWDEAVAACEKAVALDGSSNNHLWYGRA